MPDLSQAYEGVCLLRLRVRRASVDYIALRQARGRVARSQWCECGWAALIGQARVNIRSLGPTVLRTQQEHELGAAAHVSGLAAEA